MNCGGYPFGEPGERGTACLLAAQQAHLPAYAVTSRGASLLDGEGHARELILSPETMTVLRGVPQRLPASFSYGARACARFAPARDRFSPPECVEPRALAGAQLREWACLGPAAASAVPPERASRGAVGDPVPLGGEARRGGPITDPRVPPALLETGRWSITTVEVARTEVGTAAHVHAAGSLLLLVNAGALEVEVQGSPPTTVYPGEWVYLPAGVPHRMAVLERTSVTLHLREG
ncbi:MAG TPA: cupin domain-containing protein, partial [Myxococcaceae bacterium]